MATQVETIAAGVVVAVLMASAFLWARIAARLYARETIFPDQRSPSVPWGLIDVMVVVLIKMGMDVGMMAAASRWLDVHFASDQAKLTADQLTVLLLATSISNLLTTLVVVLLLRLRHANWVDLGLAARGIGSDIQLGFGAFVVLAVPMYAIQALLAQLLPPDHPIITLLVENNDAGVFYLACFAAVIGAPIAEELLFRVVLQGWLENVIRAIRAKHSDRAFVHVLSGQAGDYARYQRPLDYLDAVEKDAHGGDEQAEGDVRDGESWAESDPTQEQAPPASEYPNEAPTATNTGANISGGAIAASKNGRGTSPRTGRKWWPVIITSLLFALAHSGQGPAPVPLFLLSLGLGYIYQRTGRILPCIIVHALVNGSSLAALALSRGG